jgi:hypothetical protein
MLLVEREARRERKAVQVVVMGQMELCCSCKDRILHLGLVLKAVLVEVVRVVGLLGRLRYFY